MTYAPWPGSLAAKVVAFFEANPDEELTREDMAAKFDVAATSVAAALRRALAARLIERCYPYGDARRSMYRKARPAPVFPVQQAPLVVLAAQLRARIEREAVPA